MSIAINERLTSLVPTHVMTAEEASAFPKLPAPALDAVISFERHLHSQRRTPLPSDTEEHRRLRRNRYSRRICRLVYQTMNQAVILEADLRLTPCDLLARNRWHNYNNPAQWGPLIDSELPDRVPNNDVTSWNSIFQFLKAAIGCSFHIVFVSITDDMLVDDSHWAAEFLKWGFSECNLFLPDDTNLVFVPWLRTPDSCRLSDVMPTLRLFCVYNTCCVGDSESPGATNIVIGEHVRRLVLHRVLLLKEMILEHTANAGKQSTPDLAETFYMMQLRILLNDAVLNNTRLGNQNTDMNFMNELRAEEKTCQYKIFLFLSIVSSKPDSWTSESICLKADKNIYELYYNTLYYAKGKDFGRSPNLPVLIEDDSPKAHDIHSNNVATLQKILELLSTNRETRDALTSASLLIPLFSLIGPFRCVTFRYQTPPEDLMQNLLAATELLPQLIQDLMKHNENDCGVIEVLVLELLHCVLLELAIIRNRSSRSQLIGFTWKLLKIVADVIDSTALSVLLFDKLELNHFKREFTLGIVRALRQSLHRASALIDEEAKALYSHCTEPFPEQTIARIRHCVMRLDVDEWHNRVNIWNLSVPVLISQPTEIFLESSNSASLRNLADILGQMEHHFRHQSVRKSCTQTPHTEEQRSLVLMPLNGSAASSHSEFHMIRVGRYLEHSADASSAAEAESSRSDVNEQEFEIISSTEAQAAPVPPAASAVPAPAESSSSPSPTHSQGEVRSYPRASAAAAAAASYRASGRDGRGSSTSNRGDTAVGLGAGIGMNPDETEPQSEDTSSASDTSNSGIKRLDLSDIGSAPASDETSDFSSADSESAASGSHPVMR